MSAAHIEGRRRRTLLASLPVLAAVAAVGLSVFIPGAADGPGVVVFGMFMTAMAGVALVAGVWELRFLRREAEPRLVEALDGSPGTALGRDPGVFRIGVAFLVAMLVPLVGGVVLAVLERDPAWVVILVPLGVWLAAHLVALVRGRARLGGLVLTAGGVEWVEDANWWRVSWDDVLGAVPGEPVVVLLRSGAVVESGRTTWVTFWRRRPRGDDPLLVTTRYVPGGPVPLAAAIRAGVEEPRRREWFGTPTSLLPGGTVPDWAWQR